MGTPITGRTMEKYIGEQLNAANYFISHKKAEKGGVFDVKINSADHIFLRYFYDNIQPDKYLIEINRNTLRNIYSAAIVSFDDAFVKKDDIEKEIKTLYWTSKFTRRISKVFPQLNFFEINDKQKNTIKRVELKEHFRNYGKLCTSGNCYAYLRIDLETADKVLPGLERTIDNLRIELSEEMKGETAPGKIKSTSTAMNEHIKRRDLIKTVYEYSDNGVPKEYRDGFIWDQENGTQLCKRPECSKNQEEDLQTLLMKSMKYPVRGKLRLKEEKLLKRDPSDNFSDFKLVAHQYNHILIATIEKREKAHQTQLF